MWSRVGGYRCPCPQLLRTFPRHRGNFNLFNLIYIYPSERISEADLISPDITLQHDRVLSLISVIVLSETERIKSLFYLLLLLLMQLLPLKLKC